MKKLMNKKTGEVAEFVVHKRIEDSEDGNQVYAPFDFNPQEWEDAPEESKVFYVVDLDGEILPSDFEDKTIEKAKELGNYFETKEEAEKAVEKLKALKRLKDEGMRTYTFKREKRGIDLDYYTLTILAPRDKDSLDLLFSQEEK